MDLWIMAGISAILVLNLLIVNRLLARIEALERWIIQHGGH